MGTGIHAPGPEISAEDPKKLKENECGHSKATQAQVSATVEDAQAHTSLNLSDRDAHQQLSRLANLLIGPGQRSSGHQPLPRHGPPKRPGNANGDAPERTFHGLPPVAGKLESPRSRSPPKSLGGLDSPFRRPPALMGPFTTGIQSPEVSDT